MNGTEWPNQIPSNLLVEMLSDGLLILDDGKTVVYANNHLAAVLGIPTEDLIGRNVDVLLDKQNQSRLEDLLRNIDNSSRIGDVEWLNQQNDLVPTTVSIIQLKSKNQGFVLLINEVQDQELDSSTSEPTDLYSNLVGLSPDAIVVVNTKGKITFCNDATLEYTGLSRHEVVDRRFTKLAAIKMQDIPKHLKMFASILRGKVPDPFEAEWQTKDGSTFIAEVRISALKSGRKIIGIMAIARDITERKEAEVILQESRERYSKLFQGSNDAIFIHDMSGTIIESNAQAQNLFGYTNEDFLKQNIAKLHPPEASEKSKWAFQTISETGSILFEIEFVKKNGDVFQAEVSSSILEIGGARIVQGIVRDISERKHIQEVLTASETKYRLLFEATPIAIGLSSEDGKILDFNKQMEKTLRCSREQLLFKNTSETFADLEDVNRIHDIILESGRLSDFEVKLRCGDGETIDVLLNVDPFDLDGQRVNLTTIRDITALKESEERFRRLAENARDVIYRYRVSPTPAFEYLNPAIFDIIGYTPEEQYADPELSLKLVHPDDREIVASMDIDPHQDGEPFILRWYHRDGTLVYLETKPVPVFNGEGQLIAIEGIGHDITQRLKSEQELRESEEKYRTLFDQAPVAIIITDFDGNFIAANDSMASMSGYSIDELGVINAEQHYLDPTERLLVLETIRSTGQLRDYEVKLKKKDGSIYHALLNEDLLDFGGLPVKLATIRDITQQMLAEKALQTERDRAVLYLDLMGHDIRNQLQAVLGGAEVIATMELEEVAIRMLERMQQAARRCGDIITKVKKTERLTTIPLKSVLLNEEILKTMVEFSREYTDIDFKVDVEDSDCPILGDEFLDDLIIAILENAVEHNPVQNKRVWVRLREKKNGYVLTIGDNGSGIDERTKEWLLDVKRRYGGVGLHQAIQIIEKYGGRIEVEDRIRGSPQKGAEFRIWFPRESAVIAN